MQSFPPLPDVGEGTGRLEGHLWVREYVDGLPLRFRLERDGAPTFGDADRTFRRWEEPLPYRHAVRHVRESLAGGAFADAVADTTAYTFFGVATVRRRLRYDRDRLPPFLGTEIHERTEGFRPPDRAERAFERLGLDPVNAVEKELPARHAEPTDYEVPESAWYPGPAAGVVFRAKSGDGSARRAVRRHPALVAADPEPPEADPDALAERVVTDARIEEATAAVAATGDTTPEAVAERVLDRAVHESLGAGVVEMGELDALESAVARAVRDRFR